MPNPPHRKTCKRYNLPSHAHGLTFSCHEKRHYLADENARKIFMEEFKATKEKHDFLVWAYVLMSTHVHLLICPRKPEYSISAILRDLRVTTSSRYAKYLRENQPDKYKDFLIFESGREMFRFWKRGGGYDKNFLKADAIHGLIRYIEQNPVKAGLAKTPQEWRWSGAYAKSFPQEGMLIPDEFRGQMLTP